MTDPIADFITRIKNASQVGKASINVPFSKMKWAIAEVLKTKGFIGEIAKKEKGHFKEIEVTLLYSAGGQPVVSDVQRISKPGRRIYAKSKEIRPFRRGFGLSVFSTPKGILADKEARQSKLGGEFLFNIW